MRNTHLALALGIALALLAVLPGCPNTGTPPLRLNVEYQFWSAERIITGTVRSFGPGNWVEIRDGNDTGWVNLGATFYIEQD